MEPQKAMVSIHRFLLSSFNWVHAFWFVGYFLTKEKKILGGDLLTNKGCYLSPFPPAGTSK